MEYKKKFPGASREKFTRGGERLKARRGMLSDEGKKGDVLSNA